jgi:hypothetical protein|tara:strand:+ start:314 stop:451 length:138 start_codon:yes stop_codon:yes gene_type:complete
MSDKKSIKTIKIDPNFFKLASSLSKKNLSYSEYKKRLIKGLNKKK